MTFIFVGMFISLSWKCWKLNCACESHFENGNETAPIFCFHHFKSFALLPFIWPFNSIRWKKSAALAAFVVRDESDSLEKCLRFRRQCTHIIRNRASRAEKAQEEGTEIKWQVMCNFSSLLCLSSLVASAVSCNFHKWNVYISLLAWIPLYFVCVFFRSILNKFLRSGKTVDRKK